MGAVEADETIYYWPLVHFTFQVLDSPPKRIGKMTPSRSFTATLRCLTNGRQYPSRLVTATLLCLRNRSRQLCSHLLLRKKPSPRGQSSYSALVQSSQVCTRGMWPKNTFLLVWTFLFRSNLLEWERGTNESNVNQGTQQPRISGEGQCEERMAKWMRMTKSMTATCCMSSGVHIQQVGKMTPKQVIQHNTICLRNGRGLLSRLLTETLKCLRNRSRHLDRHPFTTSPRRLSLFSFKNLYGGGLIVVWRNLTSKDSIEEKCGKYMARIDD